MALSVGVNGFMAGGLHFETNEPMTTEASLAPILHPRSVAVVGVSKNRSGIGRRVFDCLRAAGYHGAIFPISKDGASIEGVAGFASISAVAQPIDLAVIAVPRGAVAAVVDECVAAGVKGLVVITAGYAEAGDEGRALQDALVAKVRGAGMRMVGPNCMGVLCAEAAMPMNASFSPIFPPPGGLALSSQSGALGMVILSLATRRHVGLSSFVSVGNKADVSSNDLLEYWETDDATKVIALYLESFGNPRRFANLARRIGRRKPIIAVKAGRTSAGSRAAGSHTAALAASDTTVAALFRQTGVIRADTIDEMFDLAACLSAQPLPRGGRVAIVTNAGGPGILAADACEAAGLTVVRFSEFTRARLQALLPAVPSVSNPVDMIASAGPAEYEATVDTVLRAGETDALIILYTPVDPSGAKAVLDAVGRGIVSARASGATGKPIVACLMAGDTLGRLEFGGEQIPVYEFPENAARALGKVVSYAHWRETPLGEPREFADVSPNAARAVCQSVIASRGETWLTEEEMRRVLAAFGVPLSPTAFARTAERAAEAAEAMGYPVVAKLVSSAVTHKSDLGGVLLNLGDRAAVIDAFRQLEAAALHHGVPLDGALIQPMVSTASGGVETMVGVVNDRLFGPIIGFGLGGTDVELQGDMHFRLAPLAGRDAEELIAETRAGRLLSAHRGKPAADIASLSNLLARISALARAVPEIRELDLNPVIVKPMGHGLHIVDARIKVSAVTR